MKGVIMQTFHGRMQEDIDTCAADDEYRYQHHDGDIGGRLPQDRARAMHVPNLIERTFHGLKERIHRPKEDQDTDADEQSVLRCLQIALHHLHDGRYQVRLAQEGMVQLRLDHIGDTEAFRYGDDHRQDRYDGEDKRVGEALRFVVEVLARETACHQDDSAYNKQTESLEESIILGRCTAPHVVAHKIHYLGEFLHGVKNS